MNKETVEKVLKLLDERLTYELREIKKDFENIKKELDRINIDIEELKERS